MRLLLFGLILIAFKIEAEVSLQAVVIETVGTLRDRLLRKRAAWPRLLRFVLKDSFEIDIEPDRFLSEIRLRLLEVVFQRALRQNRVTDRLTELLLEHEEA